MIEGTIDDITTRQLPVENLPPMVNGQEHLPLNLISWTTFETLCCKLADALFYNARIYGRKGQSQEGIDITCLEKKTTTSKEVTSPLEVFIQCKHVEEFTPSKLEEAVRLFLRGEYGIGPGKFIICTKNDYKPDSSLEKKYRQLQLELGEKSIEFILWDAAELEKELIKQPQIVYDVFDRDELKQWTTKFCGDARAKFIFPAFKAFPKRDQTESVKNYINRWVYFYKNEEPYSAYSRVYQRMPEVLRNKEPQKIILLSAAGAGKSEELKQLEHVFSGANEKLFPIRIKLNDYTGDDFEKFIAKFEPDFVHYDPNKILLLLDGYDEVSSQKLEIAVGNINQFTNATGKYKNIRIVISSRSNFFKQAFKGFATYFLDDIGKDEIEIYASNALGHRAKAFKRIVMKHNLEYLLSNAFNLIKFVEIFDKKGASNFPKNRAEAFESIIQIKLEEDSKRIGKHPNFSYNIASTKKYAQLIAISMEQLGHNKISGENFREIIRDKEVVERLKYSFFINDNLAGIDEWKFEHNNFQEYLAAVVLSKLSVDHIRNLVSFKGNEKIKPRWVNTLSFLFSILKCQDEKFSRLLNWIISIEPEVIIKFEREVLGEDQRLNIIKSVFEYYKIKGIIFSSDSLEYDHIARFCGPSQVFAEYFLHEMKKSETEEHLVNVISTLRSLESLNKFEDSCKHALFEIIENARWANYTIIDAIECLFRHFPGRRDDIDKVILNCPKVDFHTVRSRIYEEIVKTTWCDEYIDFFLEGLRLQKRDTEREQIFHPCLDLLKCIHQCTNPSVLIKILRFAIEHCEEEYNHDGDFYTYRDQKMVSETLINNCVKAYQSNTEIAELMIDLARCFDRHHDTDQIAIIRNFFAETETSLYAMLQLIKESDTNKNNAYACVMDESCNNYIVDHYLTGEFSEDFIWKTLNCLSWAGAKELQNSLYRNINAVTSNKFVYLQSTNWDEIRERKHLGDLKLLQDQEAMTRAMESIFTAYGREELTEDDLYAYKRNGFSEEEPLNNIALRELQNICTKDKPVALIDVHERFDTKEKWEWFIISNVYQFLTSSKEIGDWHKKYVIDWCYKEIDKCDFTKAVWMADSRLWFKSKEYIVSFFWMHANFELDDSILLQMLCFDFTGISLERSTNQPVNKTLVDYIAERIKVIGLLEKDIILHLKEVDVISEVAGSLIRQCQKLQLFKALPYIRDWMIENRISEYNMAATINAYIEIGGEKRDLLAILSNTDCNRYWHWHLIRLLIADFQQEIIKHVQNCFRLKAINDEYKLECLKILINAGIDEGWTDFKDWIYANKRFGHYDARTLDLSKLNLEMIVIDLFDLLLFSYKNRFDTNRLNPYSDDILELIIKTGLTTENGFNLVMNAFDKFILDHSADIPEVKSQRYVQQRLEKNYYINKGDSVTMEEVISQNELINSYLSPNSF